MGKIRLLDPNVIAKIAAGEVVERPSSVIKELIENAIDAKATMIDIEIEESGLTRIQITDNGEGMDENDILLSFQPHATSKLAKEEDLLSIATLVFSGEELASIRSISHMTIASRTADAITGNSVICTDDPDISPIGMPVGTRITIDHIFSQVPARKKFLKQPRTEWQHILETVTSFAAGYSETGFTLKHDGKIIINLPEKQNAIERLSCILGDDIAKNLLPLEGEIKGYIGKPQIAAPGGNRQFLFINNRLIKKISIAKSIKKIYGTLIPAGYEPTYILFLTIPPDRIDINIHPRKETIRLSEEITILSVIEQSIAATLAHHNLTYRFSDQQEYLHDAPMHSFTASLLKDGENSWSPRNPGAEKDIAQIHSMYLVTETKDGLLFIDQHAAHERILYEEYLERFNSRKEKTQSIKLARDIIVQMTLCETDHIEESLRELEKIGFSLNVSGQEITVTHIPTIFQKRNIAQLLREVLQDLEDTSGTVDPITHKTLSYLACRSAIKTGDILSPLERKELLQKLFNTTKTHYTCPHGRPTHLEITLTELNRLFKRT